MPYFEICTKNYDVYENDQDSKQYYAHMEGYNYIPVSGSFCEKRRDALEYAKMMMCLSNRVQQIEDKKQEAFYNYINGD